MDFTFVQCERCLYLGLKSIWDCVTEIAIKPPLRLKVRVLYEDNIEKMEKPKELDREKEREKESEKEREKESERERERERERGGKEKKREIQRKGGKGKEE